MTAVFSKWNGVESFLFFFICDELFFQELVHKVCSKKNVDVRKKRKKWKFLVVATEIDWKIWDIFSTFDILSWELAKFFFF